MITQQEFESTKSDLRNIVLTVLLQEITNSKLAENKKQIMTENANDNAREIVNLVEAIAYERGIFLVAEKKPKYLDEGPTFYSLYYIDGNYKHQKFFLSSGTMELFGAEEMEGGYTPWTFTSDDIGMSRGDSALQSLARFLERLGIGQKSLILGAISRDIL